MRNRYFCISGSGFTVNYMTARTEVVICEPLRTVIEHLEKS
jgi:hypothetical protein